MKYLRTRFAGSLLLAPALAFAQVPILHYAVNDRGQAQIEVASTPAQYYLLHVRQGAYTHAVALAPGQDGTTCAPFTTAFRSSTRRLTQQVSLWKTQDNYFVPLIAPA